MTPARLLALATLVVSLPLLAADKKPKERTVTLDVKDVEVREILKTLQTQCGIKNLVIDPNVKGKAGTFLFNDVPCHTAFSVVLRATGLHMVTYENNVVEVGSKR